MITVVNSRIAKIGYSFIHGSEAEECKTCKLKKTCVENLERGRRYRVISVRKREHNCFVVGKVKVVEVEEEEIPMYVPEKLAIQGVLIEFEERCRECERKEECHPVGLRRGDRVRIKEILREKCPKQKMLKVYVKRI